ncbi:class I SAM-dependent methyltransferase [Peptoniphilus harei]|uniref:class I SAM-dependent methyltransferase n=1 Tax=Peptoniphilus harei TaxID=54005 RepID=UPI00191A717C|nr:class I SAM-dependent methyltransferase [Peptoniphilus harei]QQT91421.1 class I SAM-dependent methyltransferase [Peptoniphilus harei]
MYNTSINSIVINNFYCNFINEYIKNNNHRKIRILEIGAGTGATSEKIIDLLNGVDYEYHFTDGKKYFLSKAKKKFEDNKNVKIYQLDINEDPIKIGIEYNYLI